MNLMIAENHPAKAGSAVYLLRKYVKNTSDGAVMSVTFAEDSACIGDGYRIEVDAERIHVFGNTPVAFNAAVGDLLRHQQTGIQSKTVEFFSDFRSVYFANHFYNYYHSAPVEELCEYLESLALWGETTLSLWFDMHHFTSISDPHAQAMIQRMVRLFEKARSLGMKTSLTRLTNEYYVGAPKHLLAENTVVPGRYKSKLCGYYYTELCPSNTEGEALLLESFEELLGCFSEVGLDCIMLWPYDQGGCTCEKCYPWGSNGFWRIAQKHAAIAKKIFPKLKIIFSCWRFDHFTDGEWDTVIPRLQREGEWIDGVMIDINAQLPEEMGKIGKPIVSFPEISMYRATPWGGFGANPFPEALRRQFQRTKSFCRGGALYSEGIFEDINKAVALTLMRDPDVDVGDTVLEYCNYHFGTKHGKALADIVMRLENTLSRTTYLANGRACDYPSGKPEGLHRYAIKQTDDVEGIANDMAVIDASLPDNVKKQWRYQQIYRRALGDAALLKNGGVPGEESDRILSGLIPLYHDENAFFFVSPLTRETVMKNKGE
ncbi:MAG: hypothetical protein IJX62_07620, partial [Clostridia bacterium]|nr:hypothetical protein [Clostridia bacterium]